MLHAGTGLGVAANGDGPGIGLLDLVTGRLVDVEVAGVMAAGILQVGVTDHRNT
ncbi:hypothetical protein D3C78_1807310 [compost metagenome]